MLRLAVGMIAVFDLMFLSSAASPRQTHTYNNKYNTGSGIDPRNTLSF
jgi:hypothetical protein